MKTNMVVVSIILLLSMFTFVKCDPPEDGKPVLAVTLQEKMQKFSDYDYDKDGTNER